MSQLYQRKADPTQAIDVVFATTETVVETILWRQGRPHVETTRTAHPGDAVVTGAVGERYVISRAHFGQLYQLLRDATGAPVPGKYLPRNIVKRIKNPTGRDILLRASWGDDQHGDGHCWLVESQVTGMHYLIDAEAFLHSYQPLEENV